MKTMVSEYRIEVHDRPSAIPAQAWNSLLEAQPAPTPFMRHEYLTALHDSGSACPQTGWAPCYLTAWRGDELAGACAAYLKSHSYGEYVFDWAWADAHHRHGLAYYPKLLVAVPFTPVPGTRLLARSHEDRRSLAEALGTLAREQGLSSAHLLFLDEVDRQALGEAGWTMREGVQFHWEQDRAAPVSDFAALLSRLRRDKRKKIQQERRRVAEAGVSFEVREGSGIGAQDWDFFHRCYTLTYQAHGSTPYLTRDFFARTADSMPQHWLMFVARQGDEPVACSLLAIDRTRLAAWGRYWGCTRDIPGLHFEACYYQPLQWCLGQGFTRLEGGAQGEHKMARGLLPVATWSAHWLRDPRFAEAVSAFTRRERAGVDGYLDDLRERNPFKAAGQPQGDAQP